MGLNLTPDINFLFLFLVAMSGGGGVDQMWSHKYRSRSVALQDNNNKKHKLIRSSPNGNGIFLMCGNTKVQWLLFMTGLKHLIHQKVLLLRCIFICHCSLWYRVNFCSAVRCANWLLLQHTVSWTLVSHLYQLIRDFSIAIGLHRTAQSFVPIN